MNSSDSTIPMISTCTYPTPIQMAGRDPSAPMRYRKDSDRVCIFPCINLDEPDTGEPLTFERAGPRELILGDPSKMTAAIMTCGGLCPGLNDVIRGLVMTLSHYYGVKKILGIRYGYGGLAPDGQPPFELTPERVESIHRDGGSILGTSRGQQDPAVLAQTLLEWNVNQLYIIGGDGTQRGALALTREFERLGKPVSIVGIPKTIDNDILWSDQSFGFDTAVEIAAHVVTDAHVEAKSAERCIGVVKVMGRDSGYIAAHAALASLEANAVLIPEVPFALQGEHGLFRFLEDRIRLKDHAVLVVAEGAGQEFFKGNGAAERRDASGNLLQQDIGRFLSDEIRQHFERKNEPVNLKYLDPSYSVRSAPAGSTDRIYCTRLSHSAVHAAMAGKTGLMVSRWLGHFVHVPLEMVTKGRRQLDPSGSLWRAVLESTGQPCLIDSELPAPTNAHRFLEKK